MKIVDLDFATKNAETHRYYDYDRNIRRRKATNDIRGITASEKYEGPSNELKAAYSVETETVVTSWIVE